MAKLSVVVPAYNESEGLREFHARLAAVLDGLDLESEVLYVDDGSSDDTFSSCAPFAKATPAYRRSSSRGISARSSL